MIPSVTRQSNPRGSNTGWIVRPRSAAYDCSIWMREASTGDTAPDTSARGSSVRIHKAMLKPRMTVPAVVRKSLLRLTIVTPMLLADGRRYGGNSMRNGTAPPRNIVRLSTSAMSNPLTAPAAYNDAITTACNEKTPRTVVAGIIAPMRSRYTGRRAEQVIKGVAMMVAMRSR